MFEEIRNRNYLCIRCTLPWWSHFTGPCETKVMTILRKNQLG